MSLSAKIQRYFKLLERARSDYDAATEALANAQARVADLDRQIGELQEYADQLGAAVSVDLAQHMLQRRQYLSQVFRAIDALQDQQREAQQALERAQHRWREARAQMKAVEQLLRTYQQQQRDLESRLEQRGLDEQAAWQYRAHR